MTSETRTLIDLSDVAGVEIECRECKATVVYPVEKNHERISQQCPNCNETLFILSRDASGEGSVSLEQVKILRKVIKFLAKPGADLKANVRLQVQEKYEK